MRSGRVVIAIAIAACGPKTTTVVEPGGSGAGSGTGSGSAPDAGVSKDPLAAAVERIVTNYEAIGKLQPAASCNEAAALIDQWTTANAPALAQVRDAARSDQAPLVDGLFHDASPRLSVAMKSIDALATRCASEPALGEALTRLSTEAHR